MQVHTDEISVTEKGSSVSCWIEWKLIVLSHMTLYARLQLFSFKGSLLRNDLVLVWKICHNRCAVGANDMFIMNNLTSGTRGHPLDIFVPRTNLEVRCKFFSVRVIATWNQLSADMDTATNLNVLSSHLHWDLRALLYEYLD